MSISSCSDKPIVVQPPPAPGKPLEPVPRLPTFSRAELYSFPDPEDDAEAVPTIVPKSSKTPPAKAAMP
jgi:hypothetical protein